MTHTEFPWQRRIATVRCDLGVLFVSGLMTRGTDLINILQISKNLTWRRVNQPVHDLLVKGKFQDQNRVLHEEGRRCAKDEGLIPKWDSEIAV